MRAEPVRAKTPITKTLIAAAAAWALMIVGKPVDVSQRHDVGKLVFAFSLMTTYFMYSQLLPIWYENLPHETRFLVPRMDLDGWEKIGTSLMGSGGMMDLEDSQPGRLGFYRVKAERP